jgi:hypothetical protein
VVVEPTCHTRVVRLPALVACGVRVQTIPDTLATSIAATRATICSCSSTSTCWHRPSSSHQSRVPDGLPGGSVGNRNSDRRARGNSARPC